MLQLIILSVLVFTLPVTGCAQVKRAPEPRGDSNQEAVADSPVDQKKARELSDSLAKAVIEDRTKDLYPKMEQAFRDAVPENGMKPLLEQMYAAYGKPLEVEYKKDEEGFKVYGDGTRKSMRKFWYAVRTSKAKKGTYFLLTEIVPEGDSLACTAFSIVNFPLGIPPSLQ
ncbi:MAG: hypothetical protein ACJ754_14410 [Pyrinomonadaceae bacterium]